MAPSRTRALAPLAEQFKLPADLREWVATGTLLAWIEQEIDKLNWSNPTLVEYLRRHPEYRPRVLLSLLTLACVTQILSSQEIVRACQTDPVFGFLCQRVPPFAHELSQFRRKNRELVATVIACVFARALGGQMSRGPVPPELGQALYDRALGRLHVVRHLDMADV